MPRFGRYAFGWWAAWGNWNVEFPRPRYWRYHGPVHVWWSHPDAGKDDNP